MHNSICTVEQNNLLKILRYIFSIMNEYRNKGSRNFHSARLCKVRLKSASTHVNNCITIDQELCR